ncbi:MAG: AAA family ATPase [Candidatus Weimeria sp.]
MISGMIDKIFVQKDNDWGIYGIEDVYAKTYKAVGVIPGAAIGMSVTIEGRDELTKYGRQFTITSVLSSTKDNLAGIRRYLSDGYVTGCREKTANMLLRTFGSDMKDILLSEPDKAIKKLSLAKGISERKASQIMDSVAETKRYIPLLEFTQGSITRNQADKIIEQYGRRAVSVLKKNPYRLIDDIKGFGFQKADSIAEGVGIKKNSIYRIEAGLKFVTDQAAESDGDCFLYKTDLKERLIKVLIPTPQTAQTGITKEITENALSSWYDGGREKFIKAHKPTSETLDTIDEAAQERKLIGEGFDEAFAKAVFEGTLINDDGRVFTASMYEKEIKIAGTIAKMLDRHPVRRVTADRIEKSIKDIERQKTAELKAKGIEDTFTITDEQKAAVQTSLKKRVSVITGGPGRGKTTIIQVIVDAFLKSGENDKGAILMFAPTGRAAQRIHEQTGFVASTIHRGIYDYDQGKRLRESPKGKLIIVDESSMIDIRLMTDLITFAALSQIIFVGDVDQIASVGPGKVLKDFIASGEIPTSVLVKGHRNAGSIAENAALINRGREIASYTYDSHFVYIPTDIRNIQQVLVNDYIRKVNEYGIKDVLLCVAMRERGPVSVKVLNHILQEIYTKGHKEAKAGSEVFRVGDRVMQIKNNNGFPIWRPDEGLTKGVFNGEKGTIADIRTIDGEPAFVVVFDDGSQAGYLKDSATTLTLAYATTVHKCQGSEAPCVMMAYTFGDYMLLKRSLFYTGETRAKKEFRFYGEEQWKYGRQLSAFDIAVKKTEDKERNTMLAERIRQAAGVH